jgi:hypothetical protein
MANLLPPLPQGVAPGSSYWNDWYEKMRTIVNNSLKGISWATITGVPANVVNAQATTEKNTANGYAGLNAVSRTIKGVDTTDDIITDSTTKGLVMKSPNGHYWRSAISNVGVVTWTDLGTTKP